jgi:hypothetical protein
MPTPIQEKAYGQFYITVSTINKQYFEVVYDVYYNFNPNDDTYTGTDYVRIIIPISNINGQLVQCKDETGGEINSSVVIKNNQDTVLALSTNDWFIPLAGNFTTTTFDTLLNGFYSASFV